MHPLKSIEHSCFVFSRDRYSPNYKMHTWSGFCMTRHIYIYIYIIIYIYNIYIYIYIIYIYIDIYIYIYIYNIYNCKHVYILHKRGGGGGGEGCVIIMLYVLDKLLTISHAYIKHQRKLFPIY